MSFPSHKKYNFPHIFANKIPFKNEWTFVTQYIIKELIYDIWSIDLQFMTGIEA